MTLKATTSLFKQNASLLHLFLMYINDKKKKYIHSSHFGTVLFFFLTQNYKNLQKAPLNRPVVTGSAGQLAS